MKVHMIGLGKTNQKPSKESMKFGPGK